MLIFSLALVVVIFILFIYYPRRLLHHSVKKHIGEIYNLNQQRKLGCYTVEGKNGELYYLESLRLCVDNWCDRIDVYGLSPIDSLLRLRQGALYLAPAPSKIDIHPEFLIDYSGESICTMPSFKRKLRSLGYRVIDLFGPFSRLKDSLSLFLRTDSHWGPCGFHFAAEIIAKRLLFDNSARLGKINYAMLSDTVKFLRGDLGEIAVQNGYRGFDTIIYQKVILNRALYDVKTKGEILVFGDSFARYFSDRASGLQANLAYALKQPVAAYSIVTQFPGNGRQLLSYLKKHSEVKTVVWVFSAHYDFIP